MSAFNPNPNKKQSAIQSTPGPLIDAAKKSYFERGSLQSVNIMHWKYISGVLGALSLILASAILVMLPLKETVVVAVSKPESGSGRLLTESSTSGFKADQQVISYFLNGFVENVFDINLSTWKRNIDRAATITTGTGLDQLRTLVQRPEFNGVRLLTENPNFVRTYQTTSVNYVKEDVLLIRFNLTSRSAPGVTPEEKSYAITINFVMVKPKTQEEALRNPGGIYVSSFNLSQETGSK